MTSLLSDDIKKLLLEYQIPHCDNLAYSIKTYGRVLDASDTGTGKTYSSIAVAKQLGLKPFVICPKSVIPTWFEVMKKHFKVDNYGVSNYELIQNCKYYPTESLSTRVKCDFIKRFDTGKKDKNDKPIFSYEWTIPNDMLLIFDEAHKCKNSRTNNNLLMMTASKTSGKILIMSATVCDKPENFAIIGFCLGLYPSLRKYDTWLKSICVGYDSPMHAVHDTIFPNYASRMRKRELFKLFPNNRVICQLFDMDNRTEIEDQYDLIKAEYEKVKEEEKQTIGLGKIIKAKQAIEILKTPTFVKMAKEYMDQGYSVAIFVNYTHTLRALCEALDTNCNIFGEQTLEQRTDNIKLFKENKSKIIVCNIKSGGVGISLHTEDPKYPRRSLISPDWSVINIVQALGRIHRAKSGAPVTQEIVFCKDTIEEGISDVVKEKVENIANLNDASLDGYEIENLVKKKAKQEKEQDQFENIFVMINTLTMKKQRLEKELNETNQKLTDLQGQLENFIK